ncbi:sialidase family protein [Schleiferia thermophila]|uniref:BNR repeat protein n=1 Tax=Schleiferia thermophila TaxID=884107 RepID=A0A369A2Y5_9FLAO|nr:sialidase family protein [Schleiferia thermophila]RCX03565.1 BNR repeat protein [Schleiferia thermophila]GCD79801.1 hypothetical protein JCM30197_10480 [Schleiferia thermophila]
MGPIALSNRNLKLKTCLILYFWVALLFSQPKNVLVNTDYQSSFGTSEPSIAISRKNPEIMVIGTVLDGVYRSEDGGLTWEGKKLKSLYGVWGDPVLVADYRGDFHYFHLSDPTGRNWQSDEILDRIVVQSSSDGGLTWTPGSFAGFNPPKKQDKPWAVAHPSYHTLHLSWTQFDKYGSSDTADKSYILYSNSLDGGNTWSKPVQISLYPGDCIDSSATAEGAVPAVLSDSSVFIVWSRNDSLWINASSDGGESWLPIEQFLFPHRGGWKIAVPGLQRANGMPFLVADALSAQFRDHLYLTWINWNTKKNRYQVMVSRSTNKGISWTKPASVQDGGRQLARFAVTACVDQSDGTVYLLYYQQIDKRKPEYNVILKYSADGGKSWSKGIVINEKKILVSDKIFFGDYIHIDAWKGVVRPVWTNYDGIQTNVYTAILHKNQIKTYKR